ncbi:hypothetical protein FACS1894105_14170 [Clostridia bacterium]|nr:hypothetical protein FACS1894105_14170 [Clostridia bacterium]
MVPLSEAVSSVEIMNSHILIAYYSGFLNIYDSLGNLLNSKEDGIRHNIISENRLIIDNGAGKRSSGKGNPEIFDSFGNAVADVKATAESLLSTLPTD